MAREHHTTSPNPNQPDQLPNEVVTCLRNARFVRPYLLQIESTQI
jgi:hypothetical protein